MLATMEAGPPMRVVPVSMAAKEDEPISMAVPWIVRPANVLVADEETGRSLTHWTSALPSTEHPREDQAM